jgi:hypothetical protein
LASPCCLPARWLKEEEGMAVLLYNNEEEAVGKGDQQLVHETKWLTHDGMQIICFHTTTKLYLVPTYMHTPEGKKEIEK